MKRKNSLYFDCRTGVSGDMIFGALIDLGVNIDQLKQELLKLNLGGFEFQVCREERYGTRGVNVIIHQHQHHDDEHTHESHGGEHSHRSYLEIEKIILDGNFPEAISRRALSIYKTIAEAEASVHETDVENVHFHEVGRNIALFNIVGTAICLEWLEVEKIVCSALHDGTGFVACSHGLIPVPVPAVLELLKGTGFKLVQEAVNAEMVTPSGLGILKGLQAEYVDEIPADFIRMGYGFGKRDMGKLSVVTSYLLDKSYK